MNLSEKEQDTLTMMKTQLTEAIEDLSKIYALLRDFTESDSVEILFYEATKQVFHDKIKGTQIDTKYCDNSSFLGKVFTQKQGLVLQNVVNSSLYVLAIDNPFKIDIRAQAVIPVLIEQEIVGVIRFSKCNMPYSEKALRHIKNFMNIYRDIFLCERHLQNMEAQKHPFTLERIDVYKSLKEVQSTFKNLSNHTENPEIKKIIQETKQNIDSLFRYLNPNMENVSKIKSEMRELNKNKFGEDSLKILIADDVLMNVKILDSMLSHDSSIRKILKAYDGNETLQVLEGEAMMGDPVDILLLDHHMPGKLGLEIAQRLRADERHKNIVIVSITNDPNAIKQKLELYNYHLAKPFSKVAIEQMLADVKETQLNKRVKNSH